MTDSRAAFDDIAKAYRDFRPSYPESLLEALAAALPQGGHALDVGAGTGISTRQLAAALGPDWTIDAIEPGKGMHEASDNGGFATVSFKIGAAEALPAPDSSADLVLAAQALQWFDRPRFYAEADRVLVSHGMVAAIQNNRLYQESALLADYETLLEKHNATYRRDYRAFDIAGEFADAGFIEVERLEARWVRELSHSEFVGMAFSSTKCDAVVSALGQDETRGMIEALLKRHCGGGPVAIPYVSELFTARKPPR